MIKISNLTEDKEKRYNMSIQRFESKLHKLMMLKKVLYEDNDFGELKLENLNYKNLKPEIEKNIEEIKRKKDNIQKKYIKIMQKNLGLL